MKFASRLFLAGRQRGGVRDLRRLGVKFPDETAAI